MEESKRTRHANWTEQEKKVLRMLVIDRADIIEKKGGTTKTNAAKKLAWEEVLLCFNAVSAYKRSTTQLINQWRNMKNIAKKAEFEYSNTSTIPIESIRDSNGYDSDSISVKQRQDSSTTHDSTESEAPAELPAASATKNRGPSVTPRAKKNKKRNKNKNNSDCCGESHEHQLFVLAKTAREQAMIREQEAHECKMKNERESHKKRMELMCLEEEYWKAKMMKLQ